MSNKQIPAISGLENASQGRVVLYQAGMEVHAPADGIGLLTADGAATTYQPLDATLTSLAAYNTDGLLTQTAANTFAGRTLTAPAAGLTITNPAGTAGNPTFVLADDLAALEGLASTGLAARTAANTWAQRTITGTSNQVTVTDGNGVSGNPTISIPTSFITSGTYTPTGTAVANLDSVTPAVCSWLRTSDRVVVSGQVTVDFTAAAATQSEWRLTLPIASNFGATVDANGSGGNASANGAPLFINADTTNDAFFFRTFAPNTTSNIFSFIVMYRII